ncbi:response regulator [Streptomyces radicis]|uniref:DNA-binding response regulator n=1 Tax=Streptomyces radicis TaxID=1750517 RepID=A0A3A9WYI9_9ACTN|nr:response regulator transcription factor [Streptomyces radicis]RKN12876.1 DNA-binding response regulator [Streptomyces radicis]RKN27359.1 DNA-binding response regulator [Streptomyces radicis]
MAVAHARISVVIADDEPVVREGLRLILETQRDLAVVGGAGDGHEAVQLCVELRPDVLLLDVRMPSGDGIWVLGELADKRLLGGDGTRVLMLTTFSADEYIDEALGAGASGFLLKSSSYEEVLSGVRATARGDGSLSPSVARRVIDGYVASRASRPVDASDAARLVGLTGRERSVLELVGEGLNNLEIAERLAVSEHTVKSHVSRLLAKTGCRDRGQAAALARRSQGF